MLGILKNVLNSSEFSISIFSFLLHFQWELFQMPLFSGFENVAYYEILLHCTKATFGDVVITLVAFYIASVVSGSRKWILKNDIYALSVFILTGIIITIVFELLATGPLNRWEYANSMPVIPILNIGISPFLQWIFIPLLVIWFSGRHLRGGLHNNNSLD